MLSLQVGSDLFSKVHLCAVRVTCPNATFAVSMHVGRQLFIPKAKSLLFVQKPSKTKRSLKQWCTSLSHTHTHSLSFTLFSPSVKHIHRDIHEWYNSRPFQVFLNYLSSIEMQLDWSSFEVWTSFLTLKGCIKSLLGRYTERSPLRSHEFDLNLFQFFITFSVRVNLGLCNAIIEEKRQIIKNANPSTPFSLLLPGYVKCILKSS